MDSKHNKITLYTTQRPIVMKTLEEKGIYHVKREFIQQKYKEVSHLFLQCYDWFIRKAQNIVNRPEWAEYPIWTFTDPKYAGYFQDSFLITLEVPKEEVIFFKIEDWNRILNLRYLPRDDQDEFKYMSKLKTYNIEDETEIFMKPFYPQLKSEVQKSWNNLFKYDKMIKKNGLPEKPIQGSLWEMRKTWISNTRKC
ncbi:DUF3841 domain-containing protein [Clostridiaceae bacterium 35-E11]